MQFVRSLFVEDTLQNAAIESATQPSPTEKSSRTTLHYVIQNDGACDLALPPLRLIH